MKGYFYFLVVYPQKTLPCIHYIEGLTADRLLLKKLRLCCIPIWVWLLASRDENFTLMPSAQLEKLIFQYDLSSQH